MVGNHWPNRLGLDILCKHSHKCNSVDSLVHSIEVLRCWGVSDGIRSGQYHRLPGFLDLGHGIPRQYPRWLNYSIQERLWLAGLICINHGHCIFHPRIFHPSPQKTHKREKTSTDPFHGLRPWYLCLLLHCLYGCFRYINQYLGIVSRSCSGDGKTVLNYFGAGEVPAKLVESIYLIHLYSVFPEFTIVCK